jgi:hypothetical protein
MRFRKLRIAWSVAFGSISMVLIVLWWRSNSSADQLILRNHSVLVSMRGKIYLGGSIDTNFAEPFAGSRATDRM